jgi:hypothetical protein
MQCLRDPLNCVEPNPFLPACLDVLKVTSGNPGFLGSRFLAPSARQPGSADVGAWG